MATIKLEVCLLLKQEEQSRIAIVEGEQSVC